MRATRARPTRADDDDDARSRASARSDARRARATRRERDAREWMRWNGDASDDDDARGARATRSRESDEEDARMRWTRDDGAPTRVRAAYERMEAVAADYARDARRAAEATRREIDAEREEALERIEETRREVLRGKDLLERERRDFDARRMMQEDELERAYAALRDEREAFERERMRFEAERIKFDTEIKVHERYARATGGSMSARSMSYAASQSFGGEDVDGESRGFEPARGADAKVAAWADEAMEETIAGSPAVGTTSRWKRAKDKVTTLTRAVENASLTKTAQTNAAAGVVPESARASALDGIDLVGRVLCIGGLERGSDIPLSDVEYMRPGEADARGYLSWKPFASLNTPRAYAACSTTAIGGTVVIGGSDGNEALRSVEEYRESVGKWRVVDPMSVPRIWCASTMIDGVTFACGGYDGEYYLHSMEANKTFGSFDYGEGLGADASGVGSQPSSSWVTCAPMSEGRATLGVANLGGKLYAVGGFSGTGEILDLCEVYDPRADTWTTGQPLKHKRRDLGVASLNARGMMLTVGGRDERSVLNLVEAHDPREAKRGWWDLAPMHYRRQLHATVVDPSGDAVYAIGGFDGVSAIAAVEVYDVRANKWREVAPCSTARLGIVSCCIP